MSADSLEIDNELLISLVEERPVLWDKTEDEYKNKLETQNAWREICEILIDGFEMLSSPRKNGLGKVIVKRWTNLRDNWMKWHKKNALQNATGAKVSRKYIYHDQLLFLRKVALHKESSLSMFFSENSGEGTSSRDSSGMCSPAITRKRKLPEDTEIKMLDLLENEKEQNRHISFFYGVLPSLNEFNEEQTLDFQMGVLQLIKQIKQRKIEPTTSQD